MKLPLNNFSLGVGHVLLDVANIASVRGHVQVDVSLLAPGGAPRVADNPVGGGANGGGVTNSLHAVVNRASAGLQDTASVGGPRLSSNADRDRASGVQEGLELAAGGGDVAGVSGDGLVGLASGAELAVASLRDAVRVVSIGVNSIALLDGVGVGVMRPASVAAIVVVGAGSALLDRRNDQGAMLNHVERFLSLISRVSPARAAVALVLDGGDVVLAVEVAPVDITVGDSVGEGGHVRGTVRKVLHQANREFLNSHVSEDGNAEDLLTTNRNMVSVLLGNALQSALEDTKAVFHLLHALVGSVVLDHVVVELLPSRVSSGKRNSDQNSNNEGLHPVGK